MRSHRLALACLLVALTVLTATLTSCKLEKPASAPDSRSYTCWKSTGKSGYWGKCRKTKKWCGKHPADAYCRTHVPAECGFRWCKENGQRKPTPARRPA